LLENAKKTTVFLARLTFALILPAYLVWLVLISHFTMQRETEIAKGFESINLALDDLENFHDDKIFLHALFQKNFAMADCSDQPQIQLKKKISAFKKLFGKNINFIVYDSKGRINREFTEEKRFQYVLKSMYETMHLLRQYFAKDPFADPSAFEIINKRINLLRGYFGQYLQSRQLFEPLKKGYLGNA